MHSSKLAVFFELFLGILIFFLIFFYSKANTQIESFKIGEKVIQVEIVDTPRTQIQGLSGRQSLPKDHGMLFIFDKDDFHGIWMKEMNFSIDIFWLDKNLNIVGLEKEVSPQTYPKAFYPNELALYVLEVPAGFAQENEIHIGDRAEFVNK